ncbi:MAG: DUF1850 domain-containing protein [Smithellaceae bacterium]|nr:DUF1850 domain-containing protein [Smithellaceae bacterium]
MILRRKDIKDGRPPRRPSFFIALWAILALLTISALVPVHLLEIRTPKTDETRWTRIVSSGETFALGYKHSVELSMVWDFFRLDREYRLILYETRFHSSNAGLPSTIAPGERLILEKEVIRLTNRKVIIPSLLLWVNENSLNTLVWNSKELRLYELAGNALLEIRLVKSPFWKYLWGRLMRICRVR